MKEYGDRLVRHITKFVKDENVEELLNKRPAKRAKTSEPGSSDLLSRAKPKQTEKGQSTKTSREVIELDDDDEFHTDIDFSAIELQNVPSEVKSPYF